MNDLDQRQQAELKRRLTLKLLGMIGLAIVAVGLCALLISFGQNRWAALGVGGIIFFSAASVGGALGFLFAVPRVLAQEQSSLAPAPAGTGDTGGGATGSTPEAAAAAPSFKSRLLRSNTNLERISDWLTTMLVGVGLSQLGQIDDALTDFRNFLAAHARVFAPAGVPPHAGALPAVGPMVLIFGFVVGFLFLYLYTRLILVALFNEVERDLDGGDGSQPIRDPVASSAVVAAQVSLEGTGEFAESAAAPSSGAPSVAAGIDTMFRLLYRAGGYQEAIDLGAKLRNTPAAKRADYWFYLAAAFGQKYTALNARGAMPDEVMSARDNALDCARRAVEIDPSFRARLWAISDPNGYDNDLMGLRDDPTFQALCGVRRR